MIVTVAGTKGGPGKTTIATNLAAYLALHGGDVMLLDADDQASAARWVERRNQLDPPAPPVQCTRQGGDIYPTIADLAKRYEYVVVDVGGYHADTLRAGMLGAHVLVLPFRPSQYDLESAPGLAQMVREVRTMNRGLEIYAILAQAPTHHLITEAQDAREVLGDIEEFTLLDTPIRERKAYRDAAVDGLGVVEMDDAKARTEMEIIAQRLFAAGEEASHGAA